MIHFSDGRYKRGDEGSWVPEGDPESLANEVRPSTKTIDFEVASYRIVTETGGPIGEKPVERFAFIETDSAPKRTLLMTLKNDRRTFYAIREAGVERIGENVEFCIVGIAGELSEGTVSHTPPFKAEGDSYPHALQGSLGIPHDRFDFLVEELIRTRAKLFVRLQLRLFEAAMDRDLGRPWDAKGFAVEFNSSNPISGYRLTILNTVGEEPTVLTEDDTSVEEDYQQPTFAPPSAELQTMQRIEKQLTWLWWLALGAVALMLWRRVSG